jgi:ABC-2 type transport system ATP-binding protein
MWDAVRALRRQDITVVLTTHYMEEADALCDRVAIIDHGKILVEDTPAALKASVGGDKLYDLRLPPGADGERLAARMRGLHGVTGVEPIENGLRVLAQTRDGLLPQVITIATAQGLHDVSTAEPTLETVFIRLTGRDLRE